MFTSQAVNTETPVLPAVLPEDPDLYLVRLTLEGDRTAFERLYQKHLKKTFNLVFRMVGSAQEAEEITQEIFTQAYRGLPNFGARSQFYTWLYRISTNIALQHLKKQARRRTETSFDGDLEAAETPRFAGNGNPERVAQSREFYTALEAAVNSLPPNQRLVMILGPIQGHSYVEMAEILGTSAEVVKGRLHRARENIKAAVSHPR